VVWLQNHAVTFFILGHVGQECVDKKGNRPMNILKLSAAAAVLVFSVATAHAANIVEVAASTGKFNTLIAAAKAAGLVPALTGKGPITVFAPTDAAFAKLPAGTVEALLLPKNKHKLAAILKYHVVAGAIYAKDVPTTPTHVKTLKRGGDTTIRVLRSNGKVTIDNARVTTANVKASNGIIHIINRVLLPSS
jgi:uncharacterized surface protein with fasciclin (FAS1) repeats